MVGEFRSTEPDPLRTTKGNYQEDCLPFFLDDDSSGPEGSPSFSRKKSSIKSTYGFDLNTKLDKEDPASSTNKINFTSRYGNVMQRPENNTRFTDPLESLEQRLANTSSKVSDSLENIDQDYVLVSGPPMDVSSSSVSGLKPSQECSNIIDRVSAPMPIVGVATSSTCQIGSSESQDSAPRVSQASMDTGDEQPSAHCMTRIKSLQQCAYAITELVDEKMEAGKQLEAFSIQLVVLAIWKQALHICHAQAASAMEGSPSQETTRCRRSTSAKHGSSDSEECLDGSMQGPKDILSQIESEFLREFEHAEELAKAVKPGNTEMPDAMETIFQSALAFGRHGGVDELMGEMASAAALYSKAVQLLLFLLVEAPSLILNPPFQLTNSVRYRLRTYIDILNNRQGYSRSQRMTLLKCDDREGNLKNKF